MEASRTISCAIFLLAKAVKLTTAMFATVMIDGVDDLVMGIASRSPSPHTIFFLARTRA